MRKLIFLLFFTFLFAQNKIYIKQESKPDFYINQNAKINLKIELTKKDKISIKAPKEIHTKLKKINDYLYDLNITLKVQKNIPPIYIKGKHTNQKIDLNKYIEKKELPNHQSLLFTGVVAERLSVFNVITTHKNDKYNIVSFEIKCTNCNLEDFKLPFQYKLTLKENNQAAVFALVPKKYDNLKLYYFNPHDESFHYVQVPLKIKQNTISTQTNLNPDNYMLLTPINLILGVVLIISLLAVLIFRKWILIIFPLAAAGALAYFNMPKGTITLPAQKKVYILPTTQSSVIYITKSPTKAEILKKTNNFTKVKIDNKIGWVYEPSK